MRVDHARAKRTAEQLAARLGGRSDHELSAADLQCVHELARADARVSIETEGRIAVVTHVHARSPPRPGVQRYPRPRRR